jgi:hypothetical protein
MKQTETVWISKYALSSGIYLETVEVSPDKPTMAVSLPYRLIIFHGSDWHLSNQPSSPKNESLSLKRLLNY